MIIFIQKMFFFCRNARILIFIMCMFYILLFYFLGLCRTLILMFSDVAAKIWSTFHNEFRYNKQGKNIGEQWKKENEDECKSHVVFVEFNYRFKYKWWRVFVMHRTLLLSRRSLVRKNSLKVSGSDFVGSRFNMIRKHYKSVIRLTHFRSDSLSNVLLLREFRSNHNRLYFYSIYCSNHLHFIILCYTCTRPIAVWDNNKIMTVM